ncbi:hypothetical protein C8F04DRAFT_1191235 [Mycena alexandri]|uniref:Uncharacterized protein n=1 Tax=Mycena alexandri TaxID=1745969 RepID=A0AAD6WUU6_9AGAR|nr:hypothetical protein C8F04DRAFT_1191235 [Mycena alexandri]
MHWMSLFVNHLLFGTACGEPVSKGVTRARARRIANKIAYRVILPASPVAPLNRLPAYGYRAPYNMHLPLHEALIDDEGSPPRSGRCCHWPVRTRATVPCACSRRPAASAMARHCGNLLSIPTSVDSSPERIPSRSEGTAAAPTFVKISCGARRRQVSRVLTRSGPGPVQVATQPRFQAWPQWNERALVFMWSVNAGGIQIFALSVLQLEAPPPQLSS